MASKKSSGNKNLNIVARIDGAGNVTSEVDKINGAMRSVGDTARGVTQQSAGLGDAFEKLAPQADNLAGKLMGLRGSDPSGTIKNLAGALGLIPGPIGKVAMLVTSAIGIFTTLKELFSEEVTPATEEQKSAVNDLAGAYLAMGENATWAAVQQKMAADAAQKETVSGFNELSAQIKDQKKRIGELTAEYSRLAGDAEGAKKNAANLTKQELVDALDLRDKAKERLDAAQNTLKTLEKRLNPLRQEVEEINKAIVAERKREQERRDAEAKEQKEKADREAKQKAAAAAALAQRKSEISYIAELERQAAEAQFAAEDHSEEERFEHRVELQRQAAEARIQDAYRLAQALDLIEQKADAERQRRAAETAKKDAEAAKKAAEDRAKWIAEATQRAEQGAPGAAEAPDQDAQVRAINARLEALRSDEQKFLELSAADQEEYSQLWLDNQAAIVQAEEEKTARIVALQKEQAAAQKKTAIEAMKNNLALSKSSREAVDSMSSGFSILAEGMDAFGANQNLVTAAEMTAGCIKAGADAVDYTAASIANFAYGNIGTGTGLAAAAAGKWAAAAAYAKGLIDLGFSPPDGAKEESQTTAQTAAPTTALTGKEETAPTEIAVTMQFAGQAGRLGRFLVDEINAEARTPGGARVNAGVIR